MANKIEEIALKHVPACEADESNALRAALLELLEGCCAVVESARKMAEVPPVNAFDDGVRCTAIAILERLRKLGGE